MPKRIAISTLNARTIDIINTIRANAPYEYQMSVPEIQTEQDIPAVGDILFGYPALANMFTSMLMTRIAFVNIKSATFNNAYAKYKKGYLEMGETVEEVFVSMAKAREFSVEKAEAREHKRTLADVRTAFHAMNWRVQYPISVSREQLRTAFTTPNALTDFIAEQIASVTKAAEYDEFLLFKYLLIKAVTHGKMYPVAFDASDIKNAAKKFRGISNELTFISNKYNNAGVRTNTSKADQAIFMAADFNAEYDVDVLASAFNMDRATFSGQLELIDDFTQFDNERFDEIRANSTMIEEVTDEELALMKDVKAILVDQEWFQVYDNLAEMTETHVASGLYWNYFYNVFKTVSSSPFSNAVVFVADSADVKLPDILTAKITQKSSAENGTVLTVEVDDNISIDPKAVNFIQTGDCVQKGVGVHKYGAILFPKNAGNVTLALEINGATYTAGSAIGTASNVGDTITFTREGYIDNHLTALSLSGVTLKPKFKADVLNYQGLIMNSATTVTATAADGADVVVKYNGNVATGSITLAEGDNNNITIEVTGNIGGSTSVKVYSVVVTYIKS